MDRWHGEMNLSPSLRVISPRSNLQFRFQAEMASKEGYEYLLGIVNLGGMACVCSSA